ncbi:hypothetical protein BH10PLA1_BH10PLA1_06530 [soil metagenome]
MDQQNHILIIDDEPTIRVVLRAVLETDGHRITECIHGADAMETINRTHPDLVILDLNMPVLDGMSVLTILQNMPVEQRPRVIVLTAYGSIPLAVRAVRLGASDFLEKPVLPNDLRLSVAAVLEEPKTVARAVGTDARHDVSYSELLKRVQKDLWHKDIRHAEQVLHNVAKLAGTDPTYFNLLGVLHEAEGDRRSARTFYHKAAASPTGCEAARYNLQRLYELETYGETKGDVAIGDEGELLHGLHGAVGRGQMDLVRKVMEA